MVPKDQRRIVGKSELRTPLLGDYRQALKLQPGAVAQLLGLPHTSGTDHNRDILGLGDSMPRLDIKNT